jgi:hypothetical protein
MSDEAKRKPPDSPDGDVEGKTGTWLYDEVNDDYQWHEYSVHNDALEIIRNYGGGNYLVLEYLSRELDKAAKELRKQSPYGDRGRPPGKRINGATIRELRKKRGWTQAKLASACKGLGSTVSSKSVQRAEQDEPVSHEIIEAIALALGITPDQLTDQLTA